MRELAVFECNQSDLSAAIGTAALDADGTEPHEEMFVRVTERGVETPASAPEATQSSFCTLSPSLFEEFRVLEEVIALFPAVEVLDWLRWFPPAESVTVTLLAAPGATAASELRLTTDRREVTVDCIDEPELLDDLETWLPSRFDGERFLDAGGEPVPSRIRTSASELEVLVDAVSRCRGVERYPLSVDDGELRFGLSGETATVTGTLSADVEGPGFDGQYGPGFARVVKATDGQVTLQTAPEEPLAIVSTRPGATYRYVLSSA